MKIQREDLKFGDVIEFDEPYYGVGTLGIVISVSEDTPSIIIFICTIPLGDSMSLWLDEDILSVTPTTKKVSKWLFSRKYKSELELAKQGRII